MITKAAGKYDAQLQLKNIVEKNNISTKTKRPLKSSKPLSPIQKIKQQLQKNKAAGKFAAHSTKTSGRKRRSQSLSPLGTRLQSVPGSRSKSASPSWSLKRQSKQKVKALVGLTGMQGKIIRDSLRDATGEPIGTRRRLSSPPGSRKCDS